MMTSKSGHFANIFCLLFARQVASTRRVNALLSGSWSTLSTRARKGFCLKLSPQLLDVHSVETRSHSSPQIWRLKRHLVYSNYSISALVTMDFLHSSDRLELSDPPRPSRLARPLAGNCTNEDNPNFAEFDEEQRSTHYTPNGSDIFRGSVDGMKRRIPADDKIQQERASNHTVARPTNNKDQRLDDKNGKTGKRRVPQSKTLKHSDARLPEVMAWFFFLKESC